MTFVATQSKAETATETEIEISRMVSSLTTPIQRKIKRINLAQMAEEEGISAKEIIEVFKNHKHPKGSFEDKKKIRDLQKDFAKWYCTFPQRKTGVNDKEHRRIVNEQIKVTPRIVGKTAIFRQSMQNTIAGRSESARCMAIKLLSRVYPK